MAPEESRGILGGPKEPLEILESPEGPQESNGILRDSRKPWGIGNAPRMPTLSPAPWSTVRCRTSANPFSSPVGQALVSGALLTF
eukprot:3942394-Pyramimonas_sp.AAC.1